MTNPQQAFQLAEEGYKLWQNGDLAGAARRYGEAMPHLDPDHHITPLFHGEYASVLIHLGRHAEARQQYETQIAIELKQDPSGKSNAITVTRYFLAELLLHTGDAEGALDAVKPSLACGGELPHILHIVRAEALHRLGRTAEAQQAADAALAGATSDEQRSRMRHRLERLQGPK
jgi:predicted RNA polymerase sigma factor